MNILFFDIVLARFFGTALWATRIHLEWQLKGQSVTANLHEEWCCHLVNTRTT